MGLSTTGGAGPSWSWIGSSLESVGGGSFGVGVGGGLNPAGTENDVLGGDRETGLGESIMEGCWLLLEDLDALGKLMTGVRRAWKVVSAEESSSNY